MFSKRQRGVALLAALLLLSGCSQTAEPAPAPTPIPTSETTPTPTPAPSEEPKELWGFPIDDTHDAFEVPTGGRLGTVLVTVERGEENTGEFGGYRYTCSVWDKSDLETPIQTFEEIAWTFLYKNLTDANFDGYTDFFCAWDGMSMNWPHSLYLWDEKQGQFVYETTFYGRGVGVDEEAQTINTYVHYTGGSGADETYRWENGELICFRRVEYERITLHGDFEGEEGIETVTYELVDGEWQEVFRKIY